MKTYFKFTLNEVVILALLFFSFGYWYYNLVNILKIGLWNVFVITIIFTVLVRVWINGKEIKDSEELNKTEVKNNVR